MKGLVLCSLTMIPFIALHISPDVRYDGMKMASRTSIRP